MNPMIRVVESTESAGVRALQGTSKGEATRRSANQEGQAGGA